MPAPAVIPAPRAYINAVAVKGFVVELWIVIPRFSPSSTTRETLAHFPRTLKLRSRERFPPIPRAMHAGGRPCSLL